MEETKVKPTEHIPRKVKKTGSDGSKATTRSDQRPCEEHTFLTDVADVREMEQGLMKLLDDFHSGQLQAFGEDSMFTKMDQVREQQERLARLHFELDSQQEAADLESREAREVANKNLGKLMENLQELCTSIVKYFASAEYLASAEYFASKIQKYHMTKYSKGWTSNLATSDIDI